MACSYREVCIDSNCKDSLFLLFKQTSGSPSGELYNYLTKLLINSMKTNKQFGTPVGDTPVGVL